MEKNEENAFKNLINKTVVEKISKEISQAYPAFNQKSFVQVSKKLDALELRARAIIISEYLQTHLPSDYLKALPILIKVIKNKKLKGFELWAFSEFISTYGLNDFDESMMAMYSLTQEFTSEFAIRPYFIKDHKKVLKYFHKWANDKNHHIRRWISEGSRPLLPWGLKLKIFLDKPDLTMELLEKLKYDDELYVRKSVANHLNDIAKHHPDKVIKTLKEWESKSPKEHLQKIEWIKKQGLRTLIKKGNIKALALMGIKQAPSIRTSDFELKKKTLNQNENLEFSFSIESTSNKNQKILIDYAIYFLKSNDQNKPKVFKLKTFELLPFQKIKIQKKHSLRPISTMTYYPGTQYISVLINGVEIHKTKWSLKK